MRRIKTKWSLREFEDDISVTTEAAPAHQINNGIKNPESPYRKFIGCSICGSPMYGSSSKGSNGTLYLTYHYNKGHYLRVQKAELETMVIEFIKDIRLNREHVEPITNTVMTEWERQQKHQAVDIGCYDQQIKELELEAEVTVRKLKMVESETAIKYMEADLMNIEQKIQMIKSEKENQITEKPINMAEIMPRVTYFLEHLDNLLIQQIDPVKKAQFFGVFFDRIPTYEEIKSRTKNSAVLPGGECAISGHYDCCSWFGGSSQT